MKMNVYDSCKILGIHDQITPEIVKKAYRLACSKYHPDRNPAGAEIMKSVNLAYASLKEFTGNVQIDESVQNYGDDLNTAINAIIDLPVNIEICGSWVWVSGDTKPHKEQIKEAGYRWQARKKMWAFHPADFKPSRRKGKSTWAMDKIRDNFGSQAVQSTFKDKERLTG